MRDFYIRLILSCFCSSNFCVLMLLSDYIIDYTNLSINFYAFINKNGELTTENRIYSSHNLVIFMSSNEIETKMRHVQVKCTYCRQRFVLSHYSSISFSLRELDVYYCPHCDKRAGVVNCYKHYPQTSPVSSFVNEV